MIEITYVEVQGGHFDVVEGGLSYEENLREQIRFLNMLPDL